MKWGTKIGWVVLGLLAWGGVAAAVPAGSSYEAEIAKWRADREAWLQADGGWLTVAGLFWLKEGANRFGSAPDGDIVLPASVPAKVGVFELRDGKATVKIDPGVSVTCRGSSVGTQALRSDIEGDPDVLDLGRVTLHVIVRSGRVGIRMKDLDNPRRREFTGLRWFPVNRAYRVKGRFDAYHPPREIEIANVLGQIEKMKCPGRVVFSLGGKELVLEPVAEEGSGRQFFFLLRDLTAGKETYPGGRYLYADPPKDGSVVLDFNKAENPPCSYTSYATCPLPPKQNRLDVRIEAGEQYLSRH